MTQFVVSLLSPIIIVSLSISFVMSGAILSSSEHHLCHPQEALSLLQFKQEMLHINSSSPSFCDYSGQGSYPKMIFWNRSSADCCIWDGVTCHEFTGFVIGLDISCSRLEGVIHHNSSLFRLPQLHKLNLAYNYFDGSEISPNFGGLSSLTHLNLSFSGFQGIIPSKLSHLSKLVLLDLSNIHLRFDSPRDFHILLQNLTRIRVLSLRHVNILAPLPANWSSSLTYLDLGFTGIHGKLSDSIFYLPRLGTLDLVPNYFSGQFPSDIGNLTDLTFLRLAENSLNGPLPSNVSGLQKVVLIDFSDNAFDGTIPFWLFSIPSLEWLFLYNNQFDNLVSPDHLYLNKLKFLSLSNNKLSLNENKINNSSFPSLKYLSFSFCGITEFPHFLRTSQNLIFLDLSNNKLSGRIPDWIPRDFLKYVNLSHNSLSSLGSFSTSPLIKDLTILDLSSNNFQESLRLQVYHLSFIDLSNNNFNGTISMTFPKDCQLIVMNLNGNLLEGSLPRSLSNCKYLQFLDLGNNKINDTFPTFFEDLESLKVLIMKSNRFSGSLINPKNENFLPSLQILDLSFNEFTGVLPVKFFKSFKAMISLNNIRSKASYMEVNINDFFGNMHHSSVSFVMKGNVVKLAQISTVLVAVDLSSNNFTGDIPEVIGNLKSLVWLNLSHNNFSGHIPSALGGLNHLDSLDLSWNQLEGEIPHKLGDLSFLGFLNLSRNHLARCIPQGKNLTTFMNDSYSENLGLCGFPMTKDCGEMDPPSVPSKSPYQDDDDDSSLWSEFTWKSVCIGYGFGFVLGSLVFLTSKPKWLVKNVEELCWYGLLLLGKKKMCKQLVKKSRTRGPNHYRSNNQLRK